MQAETQGATGTLHGRSVLVVDDDVDALELYAATLRRHGADVRTAKHADLALAILRDWSPDVMLCDLMLPGVDGYDLLAGIRADGRLASVPVIAMSAGHPTIERDRALGAGFAGYIVKPSRLAAIVSSVLDVLARPRVG